MEGEVIPPELLLLTCTEQRSGGCQLLRHLTYCNQVLWNAGLQLREDPGDEPGYLNVVTVPGMCRDFPYCEDFVRHEKGNLVLLEWLLKKHRCIVSLEANYGTVHATSALVEAIASSSGLLRLMIFGTAADPPEVAELQGHNFALAFLEDYMTCTARMDIPIGLLLKDDARIVSLDLSELNMGPSTAEKLIEALIKNGTVEELAVAAGALSSAAPEDTLSLFTRFLLKENATIRKLNLVGDFRDLDITSWCALAQAISNVGTLEHLYLEVIVSKKKYVLFLEAVARSKKIKLDIDIEVAEYVDPEVVFQSVSNLYSALSSNTSLNKIELLSYSEFSEDDCKALADAPSNNRHLHEFSVSWMEDEYVEAFLDRLQDRLDQNYNLLLLDVPFCLDVNDQMRAAQEMVRPLSEEPVLLMNVRQKATVGEQAESMIRQSRTFLHGADLDTYMRLAGVVKRAVRCEYREDGDRQVDMLHYDCWAHIRRHLKIADVVES
ncbi:hypothetical protein HPB50_021669 [Hyalomma asiaticum]|uniref:Uncharacterized protein n=1 Tax=Hyalomma asiaticum TaxID=266040 RepID=A0ACB7TAV4_HYAAI|nr:hypothetical protein HPB50_021669 [Hyalomma asiaticum]